MNQNEIVDGVQRLLRGDATTRATVMALFPLAIRFLLSRYPSRDLGVEWDGTTDGADYVYCPDDFYWPFLVWTAKVAAPVTVISQIEFAELKARDYTGSKIYCTVMRTRQGRKKLVFIDEIGTGIRVDMWYYQKPSLISIDMIPDYYTDAIIAWIIKQIKRRDPESPEYLAARADFKDAQADLNAMSQANPAAEIICKMPSRRRR